jgi:hypothetical protein
MLFRKADTTKYFECMFFGFCPYGTFSSSSSSKEIQIWQTTAEIHSLFIIKGKSSGGHAKSAILDIYDYCFPNRPTDKSYIEIKKRNTIERQELIKALRILGFTSWVCSVENSWQMELFVFDENMICQSIKFVGLVDNNDMNWEIDSFDRTALNNLPTIQEEPNSILDLLLK